jgi:hypothetical protein
MSLQHWSWKLPKLLAITELPGCHCRAPDEMTDTDSTATCQQGDDRAYEAIAEVIRKNAEQLLSDFRVKIKESSSTEDCIRECGDFINSVKNFLGNSCEGCAKIIRAANPELSGIPMVLLAKQIRQDVFQQLDESLTKTDSGLRECEEKQRGLSTAQVAELNLSARSTYPKVISGWMNLPKCYFEDLLDYACAKRFGSQVSLERQRQALESILRPVMAKIDVAISGVGEPVFEKTLATKPAPVKKWGHYKQQPHDHASNSESSISAALKLRLRGRMLE